MAKALPIYLLSLRVPKGNVELFETALEALGGALDVGGPDERGLVPLQLYLGEDPGRAAVTAQLAPAALVAGIDVPDFTLELMPEIDWVAESRASLPALTAGRFWVHGSHIEEKPPAGSIALLIDAEYNLELEISQPGFVRAIVSDDTDATRIDWAHDSSWRFMPPVRDPLGGYLLHDVDLAVNKVLALAGREELRDFVDILYVHRQVLPLPALVWAAVGKDPGFSPISLIELLKRRGHVRPEEIARLELAMPFDIGQAKVEWLQAIEDAEIFVRSRSVQESGCLYYSTALQRFVLPAPADNSNDVVPHFGRPGGVLPQPANLRFSATLPKMPPPRR